MKFRTQVIKYATGFLTVEAESDEAARVEIQRLIDAQDLDDCTKVQWTNHDGQWEEIYEWDPSVPLEEDEDVKPTFDWVAAGWYSAEYKLKPKCADNGKGYNSKNKG